MAEQTSLFDGPLARTTDPSTSKSAAAKPFRRDSQRARLLRVYGDHPEGLTDEQAWALADVENGWKRCADLRSAGYIEAVGVTQGQHHTEVMVCATTFSGRRMLGLIDS